MPVLAVESSAPLLNEAQAAEYIGVRPHTLSVWRCTRRHGIAYIRVGRLIRYRRLDLDRWLEQRREGGEEVDE